MEEENNKVEKNDQDKEDKSLDVGKSKGVVVTIKLDIASILLSISSIALLILARLFLIVVVPVMTQILAWIGGVALIVAMALYLVSVIKNKKMSFNASMLAILCALIVFIGGLD